MRNHIRDSISFAVQNVASDPPFSKIDLVSCRNLLIYLTEDMQQKVLSAFYFALKEEGFLFLGSSENTGRANDCFNTVSKKWRIYTKIPGREERFGIARFIHRYNLPTSSSLPVASTSSQKSSLPSRSERIRHAILDTFGPPCIVVNAEGDMLYNHGNLNKYLEIPSGELRSNISQYVLPVMRSRVRSSLFKARKTKRPVEFHCHITSDSGQHHQVRVEIIHPAHDFSECRVEY